MNKKFVIISVLIALLIVAIITGSSYAYFSSLNQTGSEEVITSGTMALTLTDGAKIETGTLLPGDYIEKEFSVENTGNIATTYDIYLSEVVNTFADKTDLVYELISLDGGYNTSNPIQVPNAPTKIINGQSIGVGVIHHYKLKITFLSKNENQDDNQGKRFSAKIQINEYQINRNMYGDSILKIAGDYDFVNDNYVFNVNNTEYNVHMYNLDGNQTWTTNQTFGTIDDVGTSTRDAQNMVVVKVNGDLTINNNVTVSPFYSDYGGPKGFMLYVTGTLTNNGTINNSHGAYAVGQDVYLWKNSNGSYEFVPANGALGGTSSESHNNNVVAGNNGSSGSNRETGGGGSGATHGFYYNGWYGHAYSGAGGRGSSYSGGAGSGGCVQDREKTDSSENVGSKNKGTDGLHSKASTYYKVGGGAGNSGGIGVQGGSNGENGTGGLIIIYANSFTNNGSVTSIGSAGGIDSGSNSTNGGSSGGGSINVFYNSITSQGTYNVNGGSGGNGGAGGAGTYNLGSISTGTYVAN